MFGTYFKRIRMKAGLNQIDVAKKLGYESSQFVSNIERGICLLPIARVSSISAMFRVTESELLGKIKQEKLEIIDDQFNNSVKRNAKKVCPHCMQEIL